MVRTTVGTIAEAEISTQRTESVTTVDTAQTSTVSPGTESDTVITAPSGTVLEVLGMRVKVGNPGGATTGFHDIQFRSSTRLHIYLLARSGPGTNIRINRGIILKADDVQEPSTEIAQLTAIRSIRIDDTNGLTIRYKNETDADQTDDRQIQLVALERGVS
jgi:hypothetical protein